MEKASNWRRLFHTSFLVLVLTWTTTPTNAAESNVELSEDLRTVIILAGYQCVRVTGYTQSKQSDYEVSCDMDRLYRVRVSEEKELIVEDRSGLSGAVSADDSDHEKFMKRQLSAIVNLAGHSCAGVLSFERHGPRDNIVTCLDLSVFRIHVTPEGRVKVEQQTMEK